MFAFYLGGKLEAVRDLFVRMGLPEDQLDEAIYKEKRQEHLNELEQKGVF